MAEVIIRCPRCVPPTVRRADGSRIVGFLPEALYVGYLRVRPETGVKQPPFSCPDCGTALVEVTGEGLREEGRVRVDE